MNTAKITGRASAIYGIGPTVPRQTEPEYTRRARAVTVSAFVKAVRSGESDGGTFDGGPGRYIVGGYGNAVVLSATATRSERGRAALVFAESYPPGYSAGHVNGLGFWRDADTGRIWLDRVRTFHTQDAAVTAGQRNGELFIWDRSGDGRALDIRYAHPPWEDGPCGGPCCQPDLPGGAFGGI